MTSPHVRTLVPGFCAGKLAPGVNTRREHSMIVSCFASFLVELLAFPQVVCMLPYCATDRATQYSIIILSIV